MRTGAPLTVCFVCQKGKIEVQSMMLAASMMDKFPADTEFVAGYPLPTDRFGEPDPRTTDFFNSLSIDVVRFTNELIEPDKHPDSYVLLANKIYLMRTCHMGAKKVLFLDSDQIVFGRLDPFPWMDVAFAARVVNGWSHIGKMTDWQLGLYERMGIDPPLEYVIRTDETDFTTKTLCLKDVETGFISIDGDRVREFWDAWIDVLQQANALIPVPEDKYHIGQLACTVAVHAMKLPHSYLDSVLQDRIAHYTWIEALTHNPRAREEVRKAVARSPYIRRRALELDCCHFIHDICSSL